jgi:hypothetical protein
MIKVMVSRKGGSYLEFECRGHADYAGEGQDIICAAVSALVITTVNSLETFTEDDFCTEDQDGLIRLRFRNQTPEGTLLMNSLLLGLEQIAGEYGKKYLTVNIKEV